mmetsp:Transcript_30193/g.79861  ORF Transcript_30193/g.79861 Transcript_30193/m.79861 type:complete len:91 (+) Transcript_30193:139-411(+)
MPYDAFRQGVGIHAMEIYFPRNSVKQSDLETYMKAGTGKFTIGLGQQNMAFCNDIEDINSVCMTAVAVPSFNFVCQLPLTETSPESHGEI